MMAADGNQAASVDQLMSLTNQVRVMRSELDAQLGSLTAKIDSAAVGFKAEQTRLNKVFADAEEAWKSEQTRMEGWLRTSLESRRI